MGEYFHYVNHTKKQQFCIDSLGGGTKFSSIGCGLTARCFCLLLTESNDYSAEGKSGLVGYWVGDSVQCIGDHGYLSDRYDHYRSIIGDVISLLLEVEEIEEIMVLAEEDEFFRRSLGHYAVAKRHAELLGALDRQFSDTWRKQMSEEQASVRHSYAPMYEPSVIVN